MPSADAIKSFWKRLLRRSKRPVLDWIQIEVTSLCGASCLYCPHTVYRDHWDHGSMSLETFRSLSSHFKMADLVFLQGWGEPFLNKHLLEMVKIAKDEGVKVGLTTSGMHLTAETMDALIELRLDILGVSLAGTRPETHNRLRAGTDFDHITRSLAELKERKARRNSSVPHVHLAYLMVKSNFEDVRQILAYANETDSKDIICSNLNFFPSPELREEALFIDQGNRGYYGEILKDLQSEAKNSAINFFFYNPVLPEASLSVCPENILRSCFISYDGSVSSCVFTNIPLGEKTDQPLPKRIVYGDVKRNTLSEIWDSDAYRHFRDIFATRCRRMTGMDFIADMANLQQNGDERTGEGGDGDLRDLPVQCRLCHRIYGV